MITRVAAYALLSIGTGVACFRTGAAFKYEDCKDFITLLSGVSGMVFTIMGIWIAFLYPNAMSRVLSSVIVPADFSESRTDARRLEKIVGAVIASAFVMSVALIFSLAKTFFFNTALFADHRILFKASAAGIIAFITLVQLEAVLHVVLSNVMFINDLYTRRQDREAEERM